jgi:hypothetical protein
MAVGGNNLAVTVRLVDVNFGIKQNILFNTACVTLSAKPK